MKKWIEEKMKTATDIQHWNLLREEVKEKLAEEGKDAMKDIPELDASGLSVEVLGPDHKRLSEEV